MTFVPGTPEDIKSTRGTPATRAASRSKRTAGEDAAPAPSHTSQHVPRDFRTINGWGADLDPKNRPAVPRELPSDVKTVRGDVKHWQKPETKIYVSNEHPGITPVFGTSCPPRGLSGLLRDYAYQYGEATSRHWMTLMLADRIDFYETAVADMLTGQYVKEKGWSANLKYGDSQRGRQSMIAGAVALGAIGIALILSSRSSRPTSQEKDSSRSRSGSRDSKPRRASGRRG